MRFFSIVFWIVVILLGASFALMNSRSVEINYYVGKVAIYLPLLILIELFIGVLLGFIVMLPKTFRLNSALRKSRQETKRLEKELNELRPAEREIT